MPAAFAWRLLAYLVDLFLSGLFYTFIDTQFSSVLQHDGFQFTDSLLYSLIAYLIIWYIYAYLYFVIPIRKFHCTLGKWLFGLRIVSKTNQTLTTGTIIGRESLGKFISGILLGLGFIITLFRADGKALHDLLFDTKVVSK